MTSWDAPSTIRLVAVSLMKVLARAAAGARASGAHRQFDRQAQGAITRRDQSQRRLLLENGSISSHGSRVELTVYDDYMNIRLPLSDTSRDGPDHETHEPTVVQYLTVYTHCTHECREYTSSFTITNAVTSRVRQAVRRVRKHSRPPQSVRACMRPDGSHEESRVSILGFLSREGGRAGGGNRGDAPASLGVPARMEDHHMALPMLRLRIASRARSASWSGLIGEFLSGATGERIGLPRRSVG